MTVHGTKRRTAASHNSVAIRGTADMPRTRPARRSDAFDPNVWSGRAVQEVSSTLADAVLHQCIRLPIGACAPSHHGYQRACDLISGQASDGPLGSPVFACAGKTVLHLVSSSRRPRRVRVVGYVINSLLASHCSFVRALRPFLRPGLRVHRCAARRSRQGWPLRLACDLLQHRQATP